MPVPADFDSEELFYQAIDAGMVTDFEMTDEYIEHSIDQEIMQKEAASFCAGNSFSSAGDDWEDAEMIESGHCPDTGQMIGADGTLVFKSNVPGNW